MSAHSVDIKIKRFDKDITDQFYQQIGKRERQRQPTTRPSANHLYYTKLSFFYYETEVLNLS